MYYVHKDDWSESHNYDYWNINFTSATNVNNTDVIKTIYDPSVSGFTLPKTAAFTGFTQNGADTEYYSQFNVNGSFDIGWHFYTNGWKTGNTMFFQAFGLRDIGSGRSANGFLSFVGTAGYCWMSGAYAESFASGLCLNSGLVYMHYWNHRSYGFSVRPVAE